MNMLNYANVMPVDNRLSVMLLKGPTFTKQDNLDAYIKGQ